MAQNSSIQLVSVSHPNPPPQTPYSHLIANQTIAVVSAFQLESGYLLTQVPLAYRTWGKLNSSQSNCMVICHALSGSADVEDWWGPLLGPGRAFDPTRYFIVCANVLGSPYGTASPLTINPETGLPWGPQFPPTTPRDDVRFQKILLDYLNVKQVAVVIGGSMGGMICLEWPLCTSPGFVRQIVPIATCPRHSAWGISWGEAQRQSIYSDPKYRDGYYDLSDPPAVGLAAARMAALLTYRSRDSFESRFGRRSSDQKSHASATHNDGHRLGKLVSFQTQQNVEQNDNFLVKPQQINSNKVFSAQSYLRYQGEKFVKRFDANCYIHLTRKLDAHDVDFARQDSNALAMLPRGALVIAINTDGLFTLRDQQELVEGMVDARLIVVKSPDGHDGFLLEFEQINIHVLEHLYQQLPDIYDCDAFNSASLVEPTKVTLSKQENLFGEAEIASFSQW